MCCELNKAEAMSGCCQPGMFMRRYFTAKEKQEMLEAYKTQLEKELKGVEAKMEELNKK